MTMAQCNSITPCPKSFFCGYNDKGQGLCISCAFQCIVNGTYRASGACDHLCPKFKEYLDYLRSQLDPDTTTEGYERAVLIEHSASPVVQDSSDSFLDLGTFFAALVALVIAAVVVTSVICKHKQIRKVLSKFWSSSRTSSGRISSGSDNATRQSENTELLNQTPRGDSSNLQEVLVLDQDEKTNASIHSLSDFQEDTSSSQPTDCSNIDTAVQNINDDNKPQSSTARQNSNREIDLSEQHNISKGDNSAIVNAPGFKSDVTHSLDYRSHALEHDENDNASEQPSNKNTSPLYHLGNSETEEINSQNLIQSVLNAHCLNSHDSSFHTLRSHDFVPDERQHGQAKKAPSKTATQTACVTQNSKSSMDNDVELQKVNDSDSGTREYHHDFEEHPNKEQGLDAQPCTQIAGQPLVFPEQRVDSHRSRDVVALRSNDIPRNEIDNGRDSKEQPRCSDTRSINAEQREDSHRSRDVVALRSNDIPRNDVYNEKDSKPQLHSSDPQMIDPEQREESHQSRDAVALRSNDIPRNDMYGHSDSNLQQQLSGVHSRSPEERVDSHRSRDAFVLRSQDVPRGTV